MSRSRFYRLFIVVVTAGSACWAFISVLLDLLRPEVARVVQNRSMASAMGISTRRVDSLTFAFATGWPEWPAVSWPSYTVKPTWATDYIVEAFMVVILGGMGQLAGTVGGGAVWAPATASSTSSSATNRSPRPSCSCSWSRFILFRPSGLFATRERIYD